MTKDRAIIELMCALNNVLEAWPEPVEDEKQLSKRGNWPPPQRTVSAEVIKTLRAGVGGKPL